MQDVALEAQVGKATVSLALRNDPRLRKETRERIQKIAAAMGYRPNATVANLLAQLRASRTQKYQATIAFLNVSSRQLILKEIETFREWAAGCSQRAEQLGYSLDHFCAWENQ